ncbi:MAG: sarcosine oxidase subunit gamma [Alphaproteobacteria bacterium]|nr:sarcosine oxidase subunit gamma [Alphaproteobacteria bacterium]
MADPMAEGVTGGGAAQDDNVRLSEIGPFAMVSLRMDPDDSGVFDAIAAALGVSPPVEPNRIVSGDDIAILWLGPDEWLAISSDDSLLERLCRVDPKGNWACTDVSSDRVVLELSGPDAADVLAKGCTLDLHPKSFKVGNCAQTLFARVPVILSKEQADPTVFRILPKRSYAQYLASWLDDAIAEYSS